METNKHITAIQNAIYKTQNSLREKVLGPLDGLFHLNILIIFIIFFFIRKHKNLITHDNGYASGDEVKKTPQNIEDPNEDVWHWLSYHKTNDYHRSDYDEGAEDYIGKNG